MLYLLVILLGTISFVVPEKDKIHLCAQLSPRSLGIGQHCLSNCEGVCNPRIAIPGTIDCGNGKQRYMCISTPPTPHGR
uniref:Uncharacterized protein n=1 Tax=Babesia bovis TaxID=5865 RepID=A7AMS5_BABBO|eukprot:XP_001611427.1 hypothetical protein [Babesia bovis T2Bo]